MKIFFSGGCKNGKSTLAERSIKALAGDGPLFYIATMIPHDEEDRERIRRHVASRAGMGFETLEQGRNVLEITERADVRGAYLLDSVTALLSNEMFLPDGGIAALINTADRFGLNQNVSVFLRTAGEWKAVYTAGECSFYNSVGSDVKAGGEEFGSDCPVKDGRLYFTDTVRSHSAISVLDLASGTVGRLTDREMNITGLDFYEDGFAFIALEDNGGISGS